MLVGRNGNGLQKAGFSAIGAKTLSIVAFLLTGLFLLSTVTVSPPRTADAYPLNIQPSVPAKWDHLHFSMCINGEDEKHRQLIQTAIQEWRVAWPHFEFVTYENKTTCNINIHVTKYPTGLNEERASEGSTKLSYYEDRGTIYRADIFMFSHVKKYIEKDGYCCVEVLNDIPDRKFYLIATHEFGHALNLNHPILDDGLLPIDIMSGASDLDDIVISAEAIRTLDGIYGKSSDAIDHRLNFGTNLIQVSMDTRKSYRVDDTLHISGKVAEIDGIGQFTMLSIDEPLNDILMYSSIRDSLFLLCPEHCDTFAINGDDGTFSISKKLNHAGLKLLLIRYGETTKYFIFEVVEPNTSQHMCVNEGTLQNSWQEIEFLKMQDEYLSKNPFGNKVREYMFDEYCQKMLLLTETISLADNNTSSNPSG